MGGRGVVFVKGGGVSGESRRGWSLLVELVGVVARGFGGVGSVGGGGVVG